MACRTIRPRKIIDMIRFISIEEIGKLNETLGDEWNYNDLKESFMKRMNTKNYSFFEEDFERIFKITSRIEEYHPDTRHCYSCKIIFDKIGGALFNHELFKNLRRCLVSNTIDGDIYVNFCSEKCYLEHRKNIVFE